MLNFIFQKEPEKSFTIIELLTAIGIFTFIVSATLGIYTITIQRHFQAQQIQAVDEELRYAIELMVRDIRDGYVVKATDDTLYIANKTKLTEAQSNACMGNLDTPSSLEKCIKYQIKTGDSPSENGIFVKYGENDSNDVRLTSQRIRIDSTSSKFQVIEFHTDSQNRVTFPGTVLVRIILTGYNAQDPQEVSKITLQTSVTQEDLKDFYR